jgi:hypothetical protein
VAENRRMNQTVQHKNVLPKFNQHTVHESSERVSLSTRVRRRAGRPIFFCPEGWGRDWYLLLRCALPLNSCRRVSSVRQFVRLGATGAVHTLRSAPHAKEAGTGPSGFIVDVQF